MKFTIRIKKNGTLKYILNNGKYCTNKHIAIHFTNNKNTTKNGFGVCVSKKNGNSVQRNKLKRWAREVYKSQEGILKKGVNIVILFKKNTTFSMLDFNILNEEVQYCLKELDLYEKN